MRVIAHRGAWAETGHPEQSRAAFQAAIDLGTDGVECDVRLTADGEVVCHHDATVERLTGDSRAIHDLTLAELRGLDWGSGGILTLTELVELAARAERSFVLAIELKHPNPAGVALEAAVLAVLAECGWDPATSTLGTVAISLMTFNPESLPALLPVVPARHVTMLTADAVLDDLAYALDPEGTDAAARAALEAQLAEALRVGRSLIDTGAVGGAGPDLDLVRREPATVRSWAAAGIQVRVWTVDDPEDAALCADLGVTQLETDRPIALLAWRDARQGNLA